MNALFTLVMQVYQQDSTLNFENYKNKTLLEALILSNTFIDWSINNIVTSGKINSLQNSKNIFYAQYGRVSNSTPPSI